MTTQSLQTIYFLKYIPRVKARIFSLNETSILVSVKSRNLLFYLNMNKCRKIVRKITR